MNFILMTSKEIFQRFIDKNSGRRFDIIGFIGYGLSLLGAIYSLYISLQVLKYPVLKNIQSSLFYTLLIALPIVTFYITLSGDYFKKPSRRVFQFIFVIVATTIFTLAYIIQIANTSFIKMLLSIKNIEVIPYSLLEGNIRIISFFIPCAIVLPIAILTLKMLLNKEVKKDLIEYEVEFLLPRVHTMDDTTIDIKLCEDMQTGEDCILPEKNTFEHIILQGGTGSGKTATYIRPFLGQLFYMKAFLREMQKKLAFEALEEGIAYLAAPVTNAYFRKNFTMDIIKPIKGKEVEFKNKFKNVLLGTRDRELQLLNKTITDGEVSFKKPKGNSIYCVKITLYEYGLELAEKEEIIKDNIIPTEILIRQDLKPIIVKEKVQGGLGLEVRNESGEVVTPKVDLEKEDTISLKFPSLREGYSYNVTITEKGSGESIYKGCGVTVVAPDGGLPKDTIKIAREYGVKVHKIDPSMEEIEKGGIAQFNPLLGKSPEKTGDIISSILVSMEQTNGKDSNPYFTNASVRAVRNVTILLKVMYPRVKNIQPTLYDVLEMLNNFNLVVPLVIEMKKDDYLRKRWGAVISYFEASFFPPEVDDKGRLIPGATIGAKRQKTEDAISGVINQLDNFLGREEIKYIFCDREKSLDLAKVLEKGECIAIATRQNDLGEIQGKAFALFFILSLQNAVLSRYSEDENPEVPHYICIDEFPFYINDSTKVFFTFARKYKCSVTVAIQNMAQLREVSDVFRETIFTNTSTKMLLPKSNVEDREYWSKFLGIEEIFEVQTGISQGPIFTSKPSYSETIKGAMVEKARISEQDINKMNFKEAFYCYTDAKGRQKIGKGLTDFLKLDESTKIELKEYDFEKHNRESIEEYNLRRKKKIESKKVIKEDKHFDLKLEEATNSNLNSSFVPITNPEEESSSIESINIDGNIDKLLLDLNENSDSLECHEAAISHSEENIDLLEMDKSINMQIQGGGNIQDFDIDEIELEIEENQTNDEIIVDLSKDNFEIELNEKIDLDNCTDRSSNISSDITLSFSLEDNTSDIELVSDRLILDYNDLDVDIEVRGAEKWRKK